MFGNLLVGLIIMMDRNDRQADDDIKIELPKLSLRKLILDVTHQQRQGRVRVGGQLQNCRTNSVVELFHTGAVP